MACPHCCSTLAARLQRKTNLGYAMFRCKNCIFEGTPFNFIEVPADIVFQVLLCCFCYRLSFRNIAEFFLLREFEFTHESGRGWQECFAPRIDEYGNLVEVRLSERRDSIRQDKLFAQKEF